ncbi:ATP-binding protein [Patulibacter medicamentivorans]|uniref:ATP-binding protein n=1 Tax=Patulibacter medicamentivorans TaxID=1097667 RepID=H0E7V4_9ACTN|nr:amino acid ABC transporter ATP-binding protein [Patulibacter medicamentivorans]EHN10244.1 ATP-binding protein [Patulibacter medicamentivorans]
MPRTSDHPDSATPSQAAPVVELRQLRKSFGDLEVLKGIDLAVRPGEHVVLFGPSGSGKSTVLRSINLLEPPTSGSLRFDGVEYGPGIPGEPQAAERGRPIDLRRNIGMVFQQFNLFPHLTALENVALPLRSVRGCKRPQAEHQAAEALRRVGLLERAAHYPRQLSGGQQQRVAIARALALDPQVMLFDEPTSALDPELVGGVLATMRELAETGMTMLIVTHELGFAREIGDLNVFMEDGQVVETGDREIYAGPTNPRTSAFLSAVL